MEWIVILVGEVMLLNGLVHLFSPEIVRLWNKRWMAMDNLTYRGIGFFALVVGGIIVYLGVF